MNENAIKMMIITLLTTCVLRALGAFKFARMLKSENRNGAKENEETHLNVCIDFVRRCCQLPNDNSNALATIASVRDTRK